VVAPLRAADLSLHDDEEGIAGLALLDQHGAILEILRLERIGYSFSLDPISRAQERERRLRERHVPKTLLELGVRLLEIGARNVFLELRESC
jgi:hypothetical protein